MKRVWLAFIAASCLLTGCKPAVDVQHQVSSAYVTGTQEQQAELKELYAQALENSSHAIVVYGACTDREVDPIWKAFLKAFPGLKIQYLHVSPHQVMPRMDAERIAGVHFGDVMLQPITMAELIAEKGYLQSYTPSTLRGIDARFTSDDGLTHYAFNKVYGLAFNTQHLSAEELPQTFNELLDERWKEKFSYLAPPSVTGYSDLALAKLLLDQRVDYADLEQLARQGLNMGPDYSVTYLAQGRQQLSIWAYLPSVIRMQQVGAPIDIRFVPELSVELPFSVAIFNQVPRSQGARLLSAWLFTPDGQKALAENAYMKANMPGSPHPPLYTSEAEVSIGTDDPGALLTQVNAQRNDLRTIFRNKK